MWTLLLVMVTTGSPALYHAAPVQGHGGRCSFVGVLHVEGTSNYSLAFQKALELCQSLSYKLATQEQVIEAYKKGLRTCRYGWIDGQNVAFLPHSNSLNCDSSSNEVTFHSEAAEYLSDVYCFNPSDPFDLNCEGAVKSQTSTSENPVGTVGKRNEDILEEALGEGFLVDVEKIDAAVMDLKPFTLPVPASKELATGTDTQDAKGPTNKFRFVRSAVLLPEEEGSGSGLNPGFNHLEPNQFTTRSSIIEPTKKKTYENNHEEVIIEEESLKQDTSATDKGRRISFDEMLNPDLPSKPSGHHRKGSPTWLVVLATCVVVGAILCVFAAIATKDKWYGPKRSKNTTSEDYGKAVTLPLSHKEQEIVKLMSVANVPNGKTEDFNVANLDEREKEYLM